MPTSIFNILDLVILLSLIFFLMSVLASHAVEMLSGYLNARGKNLRRQLAAALTAPVEKQILSDPVIRSFGKGARCSRGSAVAVSPQAANTLNSDEASGVANESVSTGATTAAMPSYIMAASFARAVTRAFSVARSASSTSPVLQELYADAQHRGITFEATITEWFAQFNDRIAGTYKRQATAWLFAFGCLVALALDIDTVHLGEYLLAHPSISSAAGVDISATFSKIADTSGTSSPLQDLAKQGATLAQTLSTNLGVGPFFWQQTPPFWSHLGWWVAKVAGWLLAGIATSFGAQFWFQLLTDGLNIRLVGKRPDPTADQDDAADAAPAATAAPAPVATATPASDGLLSNVVLAGYVASSGEPPILGCLSSKYEVGNRGCGTVSSGIGDRGGVSYGSYQMTSEPNGGTVARFVTQLPPNERLQFDKLKPGELPFTAIWKQIAQKDPSGFFLQQHDFIRTTHYDPLCQTVTKVGISSRSFALQNVVWSTAVQHGPATPILSMVVEKFDFQTYVGTANELDGLVIEAIYAERGRKLPDGRLAYFTRNSAQVQASVAQRFVNEQRDALQMLAQESEPAMALTRAIEYQV